MNTEALINDYQKNNKMRNRARQLRTESVCSFCFIRDSTFPSTDVYDPFI